MLQTQVLCEGPEWAPAKRRESSAVIPAPALPSGQTADSKALVLPIGLKCGAGGCWQQKDGVQEVFVPALRRWGQQLSLQPDQEGWVCFPHCLIFLFPEPAPIFLQPLRYRSWLTGILAQKLPLYALPDLLVPACGGFCSVCASLPRVRLLCPVISWCLEVILACTGCFGAGAVFSVALRALMLCLKQGKALVGQCQPRASPRPRALWAQTAPALLAARERRWILQRIQATYSSPGSSGTREIVWQLVSGQCAMRADGLAVLAAKSLDAQLAQERQQSSSLLLSKCLSPLKLPGTSRGCLAWARGVCSRDDTPHPAPGSCYSITEDRAVSELLSAWGQLAPATILCPPKAHLEVSIAIIFLTTSARWFPVRRESWDKGIKTSSSRLQKLSRGLSPGRALMLITLRGSFPHTGMHCMVIDTSLINCY